jgi:spore germination protein KA
MQIPVEPIPSSLPEVSTRLSAILHREKSLGVELRQLSLTTNPESELLLLFIQGLADDELVRLWALEPLERSAIQLRADPLSPQLLHAILPAPRIRLVASLPEVIRAVLGGATALFVPGGTEALVLATERSAGQPTGRTDQETFGPALMSNLALIRKRLPDPALVAEPRQLPGSRTSVALLYLEGRTEVGLIEAVDRWLQERAASSLLSGGGAARLSSLLGLLPDLMVLRWPHKAAALMDEGYVIVLMDGQPHAYGAPVTAAAILYGPGDGNLARPLGALLKGFRVLQIALVLLVPAEVVALMSYHQEMLPTPFLLAIAMTRDNSVFPVFMEVLCLELLQEAVREAANRLPFTIGTGSALVAGTLLVTMLVQTRLVGPLPGIATVVVAIASLGLPSYEALYISRVWRFWMILGAGVFGFYGVAAAAFVLVVYLTQANSFAVPLIGETGLRFRSPGRASSRKGGNLSGAE